METYTSTYDVDQALNDLRRALVAVQKDDIPSSQEARKWEAQLRDMLSEAIGLACKAERLDSVTYHWSETFYVIRHLKERLENLKAPTAEEFGGLRVNGPFHDHLYAMRDAKRKNERNTSKDVVYVPWMYEPRTGKWTSLQQLETK